MEGSRAYNGQFKQDAFVWKSVFNGRQDRAYRFENRFAVEHNLSPATAGLPLTTERIVDRFINKGCEHDVHRYKYRYDQIADFINAQGGVNIDLLRAITPLLDPAVSVPSALLDDRNQGTASRLNSAGNRRASLGPLNARQLYNELRKKRYEFQTPAQDAGLNPSTSLVNAERRLMLELLIDNPSSCI